eukprot:CAMPEP_0175174064 /NCGR_PEP_ID=MMETSP0087-20121206/32417_1 /TAXON_ID=136419 /ORGANISM="Unknown Unknown, Strain D1" /LENGTH=99 /DNA_ID=CAMNT_0016465477 /DNA_START=143 /DNA_END=440 /DNA_ORIENTATION=-
MGQKQLQRLTAEFDKPQSGLWYQPAKAETSDPALIDDLANKLDAMLLNAVPHLQHSWQLISQLSDNNLASADLNAHGCLLEQFTRQEPATYDSKCAQAV